MANLPILVIPSEGLLAYMMVVGENRPNWWVPSPHATLVESVIHSLFRVRTPVVRKMPRRRNVAVLLLDHVTYRWGLLPCCWLVAHLLPFPALLD